MGDKPGPKTSSGGSAGSGSVFMPACGSLVTSSGIFMLKFGGDSSGSGCVGGHACGSLVFSPGIVVYMFIVLLSYAGWIFRSGMLAYCAICVPLGTPALAPVDTIESAIAAQINLIRIIEDLFIKYHLDLLNYELIIVSRPIN